MPFPTGAKRFAAAPPDKPIETYIEPQAPPRPHEQIGLVKGHYKAGTAWGSADLSDLLPELHAKARELGADAIIITNVNRYLGAALNPLYRTIPNVEALAIAVRYTDGRGTTPAPGTTSVQPVSVKPAGLSLGIEAQGFCVLRLVSPNGECRPGPRSSPLVADT